MLQIHQLSKSYGVASILAGVSFSINRDERIGLIGANGAGKSTLLRCIVGLERPDSGSITRTPPDLAIGYLSQALSLAEDQRIRDILEQALASYSAAERALRLCGEQLASAGDLDAALEAYSAAQARFEALGGYEREQRAAEVIERLGLGALDPDTPARQLSGGQKTRLGLATLLLGEPDLLLLDEPTNHLDITALEWLEQFVVGYRGAVLIVSHDREFLDRTVTRVLYLDHETHTLRSYSGNYSAFCQQRAQEHERHREEWRRQQEYIRQTERDIARLKLDAGRIEGHPPPRQPGLNNISRRLTQAAKNRERKLERYLESDERVEKPKAQWGLKLDFGDPPPGGRAVLRVEQLSFAYPGAPTLLRDLSFELQHGERVAIGGPNGAGKTTLLRLIQGQLQPTAGSLRLGAGIRLGWLAQEHETLAPRRTLLETALYERAMSETDARRFLHFFLFAGDAVFKRVGDCSLGERSRLQLALLVLRGCNLLLLDEPLNHLDIAARQHFEQALEAFEGTVVLVAHDRAFIRNVADRVIEL